MFHLLVPKACGLQNYYRLQHAADREKVGSPERLHNVEKLTVDYGMAVDYRRAVKRRRTT